MISSQNYKFKIIETGTHLETRSFYQISRFSNQPTTLFRIGRLINIFLKSDRLLTIKDESQFNGFCHYRLPSQ